jgi:soluble lytic murein transglycosylase
MRAESQYKKDIVSPVGALGLMQVMPNTASKVAHLMGENEFRSDQLLEPEWAIPIGAKYLSRLTKKFSNSIPLVAASYNAGPHRVGAWLNSFGDLDMDEFIEHIPFMETRNYVKKVVSNFYIYNHLYGTKKEQISSLAEPVHVRIAVPMAARETWEE